MPYYVYVSVSSEDRVNVFTLDPETGALDTHAIVAVGNGPTAMCVDPQQRFLYTALRGGRQAAAFRIDKASGRLGPLGTAPPIVRAASC
jgi:6-phosphogluconolactonase (cycloisomerase 2 family)